LFLQSKKSRKGRFADSENTVKMGVVDPAGYPPLRGTLSGFEFANPTVGGGFPAASWMRTRYSKILKGTVLRIFQTELRAHFLV